MKASLGAMQKEMIAAGVIQETFDQVMDEALGGDEINDAADVEVDKIMEEIKMDTLGQMSSVPQGGVAAPQAAPAQVAQQEEDELEKRMAALNL